MNDKIKQLRADYESAVLELDIKFQQELQEMLDADMRQRLEGTRKALIKMYGEMETEELQNCTWGKDLHRTIRAEILAQRNPRGSQHV